MKRRRKIAPNKRKQEEENREKGIVETKTKKKWKTRKDGLYQD
jgi:hypothetical protein